MPCKFILDKISRQKILLLLYFVRMGCGVCLFIVAIITLIVAIFLALSTSWLIPRYLVDKRYIRYNKSDTDRDVRMKCKCLEELEQEIYDRTDKEEKKHKEWSSENPSVVSVILRKYIDDPEDFAYEFACTGVILNSRNVLGGNACFEKIPTCAVKRYFSCFEVLKVRSGSRYWSTGGELRNVTEYNISPENLLSIFIVHEDFKFGNDLKPISYPGKQKDMTLFYFVGWENSKKTLTKYGLPRKQKYSTSSCSNNKVVLSNTTEKSLAIGGPLLTHCNELTGFEMKTGVIDVRLKPHKKWILTKNSLKDTDKNCCTGNLTLSEYKEGCNVAEPTC